MAANKDLHFGVGVHKCWLRHLGLHMLPGPCWDTGAEELKAAEQKCWRKEEQVLFPFQQLDSVFLISDDS